MRKIGKVMLFILISAGLLTAGCAGNLGDINPVTATAQADRIIGLATQMGGYAKATLVAENQQVTATAAARQTLLEEVEQWHTLISDSFDENLMGWTTGEKEEPELGAMSWFMEGGKYRWQGVAQSGFVWWVNPDIEGVSDFYLSVSARQVGKSEVGEYGLVFRESGDEEYYLFEISNLKMYALYLYTADRWETLIDWTAHPSIYPDNSNQLVVIASGDTFNFFINGEFVAEFSDDRLHEGKVGLLVGLSNPGEAATWEFDDFELRTP